MLQAGLDDKWMLPPVQMARHEMLAVHAVHAMHAVS